MRAAFLGTPPAAVPALAAAADVVDIAFVVTRPDAAAGRNRRRSPSAVKVAAREWGFPVASPSTAAELSAVFATAQVDVGIVVAYGMLLRPELLAATRFGFVNVHFSLLPRWRGAAPVERAILAGDVTTGVSLMQIDEGLDTGPVIAAIETPIAPDETGGSLGSRLSFLGAALIDDALPGYLEGGRHPAPQIDAGATRAPILRVDEARLAGTETVDHALRMIRAFRPRPGAWVRSNGDRYKIWAASAVQGRAEPGVIDLSSGIPVMGLDDGAISIDEIQAPGGRVLDGEEFTRGFRDAELRLDPVER